MYSQNINTLHSHTGNAMRRTKKIIIILILTLFILLSTSCQPSNDYSQSAENFLKIYYTLDLDDNSSGMMNDREQQFDKYKGYVTEACLQNMMANRMIFEGENPYTMNIKDIKLVEEKTSKNEIRQFSYSASIVVEYKTENASQNVKEIETSGIIAVTKVDETYKVSFFQPNKNLKMELLKIQ
ncbi:MAG: hypothetical protein HGA49_11085 [Eubacteriaceae bacterium]|nr:hypothetical protein [Eubacteriaceae bacterium]